MFGFSTIQGALLTVPQMLHNHHYDEGTGQAQLLEGRSDTALSPTKILPYVKKPWVVVEL